MSDDGGAAYPSKYREYCRGCGEDNEPYNGMTLLDHFAAAASSFLGSETLLDSSAIAKRSYDIAEAMVAEKRRREGTKPEETS